MDDPIINEEKVTTKPKSWLAILEWGIVDSPPERDLEVVEIVEPPAVPVPVVPADVTGVATGVAGEYVTPFMSAATWKTEPPPYS